MIKSSPDIDVISIFNFFTCSFFKFFYVKKSLLFGHCTAAVFYFREQKDALYEQICMLMNVALWYTKHASKMAGHEE